MLAVMSRGRRKPKEAGAKKHHPASLEAVVEELEMLAASLKASAARLKDNEISSVQVPYENSLEVGLDKLHTWTNGVKQAVSEAVRRAILGEVSDDADTVSDDVD